MRFFMKTAFKQLFFQKMI